mmetsp:Transcript_25808/g.36175  ORF Transcript_25808/g.36175 Transcript_25808/m.36175 type:complete len:500 (-) Transcript_25808:2817-4316(-)
MQDDFQDESTRLVSSSGQTEINYGAPASQSENSSGSTDQQVSAEDSSASPVRSQTPEVADEENQVSSGSVGYRTLRSSSVDNEQRARLSPTTTERDGNDWNESIAPLTRRLRCLFSTITWPIVPLGSIVFVSLLWVLYAAFVLDARRKCSHPLHFYAVASLLLVTYAPYHAQARSYLFHYSRERDGPVRPRGVRLYDQLFHTICLLYVYGGITLMQSCDDYHDHENGVVLDEADKEVGLTVSNYNTCEATCPNIYHALSLYIMTLQMFTFALILPLLFLPCIYLWILRQASEEMSAFSDLQDRIDEEGGILSSEGVNAQELMDSLDRVKLVSRTGSQEDVTSTDEQLVCVPVSMESSTSQMSSLISKECCICMSEFEISKEGNTGHALERPLENDNSSTERTRSSTSLAEEGFDQSDEERSLQSGSDSSDPVGNVCDNDNTIVRTKCGHVFHQKCLAGWIGGRWEPSQRGFNGGEVSGRRRARRTCCPLCRHDLKPLTV